MKTDRFEYSIEHIVGLKGARVLADITDFRVDILAFVIGPDSPMSAALPVSVILESVQARIRHEIRLHHKSLADAVVPADEPGGVA